MSSRAAIAAGDRAIRSCDSHRNRLGRSRPEPTSTTSPDSNGVGEDDMAGGGPAVIDVERRLRLTWSPFPAADRMRTSCRDAVHPQSSSSREIQNVGPCGPSIARRARRQVSPSRMVDGMMRRSSRSSPPAHAPRPLRGRGRAVVKAPFMSRCTSPGTICAGSHRYDRDLSGGLAMARTWRRTQSDTTRGRLLGFRPCAGC